MKQSKDFIISIRANIPVKVDEIWPDGDEPDKPTVSDVVKRIIDSSYDASNFISEWNLDNDIDITVFTSDRSTKENVTWKM